MSGTLANYNFGGDGVNLVKDPLELSDSEATQLQNAERVPDQSKGGEGSLSKRGGLAALTTALAGSVLGMVSLPLQTTYTRTLYALNNGLAGFTAYKTTDGTTWTGVSTLTQAAIDAKDGGTDAMFSARRHAGVRTQIYYPGDNFTKGTTYPPVVFWDGTNSGEITRMPKSYVTEAGPGVISDMLVANGKLYIAVMEPVANPAPGAVYELNLDTGYMKMVANAFGTGGSTISGAPTCLAWYQGRLFVGVARFSSVGSQDDGHLASCNPDFDTQWTQEGNAFNGVPISLCEFLGDLYIGTYTEDASAAAGVTKRAAATGVYTNVYTANVSGQAHVASLLVFSSALYGIEYHNSGTDVIHVKKSTDGTSWTTDLDVDAALGANLDAPSAQRPGNLVLFGSNMYACFRTKDDTAQTGYVYERTSAGVWTARLSAKGLLGGLVVLTERT